MTKNKAYKKNDKKRKSNKIMVGIVTMMMAFCILANVDGAFASTDDTHWSFSVSPQNTSYQYSVNRKKDTNSKFYFKWEGNLNGVTSLYLTPVAERTSTSKYRVACIARCIAPGPGQYRVTNQVYENGYAYANLGIRSQVGTGLVSGEWSPDTHTDYKVLQ